MGFSRLVGALRLFVHDLRHAGHGAHHGDVLRVVARARATQLQARELLRPLGISRILRGFSMVFTRFHWTFRDFSVELHVFT